MCTILPASGLRPLCNCQEYNRRIFHVSCSSLCLSVFLSASVSLSLSSPLSLYLSISLSPLSFLHVFLSLTSHKFPKSVIPYVLRLWRAHMHFYRATATLSTAPKRMDFQFSPHSSVRGEQHDECTATNRRLKSKSHASSELGLALLILTISIQSCALLPI